MWRRISSPLRSGIWMSSSTRSHSCLRSASSVSLPLAASPTASMVASASRNCLNPARTTAWSSAISTLDTFYISVDSPAVLGMRALLALRVSVEFVVQRLEAAAQRVGGPPLVAFEIVEGRLDQRALHVVNPGTHPDVQLRGVLAVARGILDQRRQFEHGIAEYERALDAILEFPDISRPRMLLQRHSGKRRQPLLSLRPRVQLLEEMRGQQFHIAVALPQRR